MDRRDFIKTVGVAGGAAAGIPGILGGLASSTFLDMIVTPAVFWKFGRKAVEGHVADSKDKVEASL